MKKQVTRRHFLATAGAAASVTLLSEPLFDRGTAEAAVPLVRRDVGNMDASDPVLVSYGIAIQAMKALPNSNPLSWAYQAAIHGTTLSGSFTSWNTCEHGTDFFWSWHRMYLYWFERIIRKMCKEPCWALPYWDWAPGNELYLPAPFRDTTSPLYAPRNTAINNGTGSLNSLAVDISGAFSNTNFLTTNSIIQGPHGNVHGEVGGLMCCVPTAALDPIFYLHHANVDRQWNLWLAQGGGRTDPLLDVAWKTRQYTFFDENGAQVQMNACQILRAAEQLNYVYECEPPQVKEYCRRIIFPPPWQFEREVILHLPIPPVELNSEPVTVPIELKDLRSRIAGMAQSATETVLLELDEVVAEKPPEAVWAVYVGPATGPELNEKSPSFVGSFSLFGAGVRSETHHEFKPANFLFPLNRALHAAFKANEQRLSVTFVPIGILIEGKPTRPEVKSSVRIGKATLIVERRTEAPKERSEKPE